jgi:uncharacterized membrane protein YdjX (TVP38/TMEM64 family)
VRPYLLAGLGLVVVLLALFGLAEALELPLLSDETPDLGGAGLGAGAASFALLAGDVVLPVPSSALMILNGSLFGPAGGALLSLAGSEASALLGFLLGRRGGPWLERFVSAAARERVAAFVAERGTLAIVVTRPVPVIAETAAILAGATAMPLRRLALAAAIGSLPPALAYALVGAYAERFDAWLAVFGGVLVLAAAFWLVDRRRRRRAAASAAPAPAPAVRAGE